MLCFYFNLGEKGDVGPAGPSGPDGLPGPDVFILFYKIKII